MDIGLAAAHLGSLGVQLNCNVLLYDYSGYGLSTGIVREANLYADIQAAWDFLTIQYVRVCVPTVSGIRPTQLK